MLSLSLSVALTLSPSLALAHTLTLSHYTVDGESTRRTLGGAVVDAPRRLLGPDSSFRVYNTQIGRIDGPTSASRNCFQLSDCRCRDSGFAFRVSSFGFRVSSLLCMVWIPGSGVWVPNSRFQVPGSGFRVMDPGFRLSGFRQGGANGVSVFHVIKVFRLRVSCFWFRVLGLGFGFRVPDLRFRVSEFRVLVLRSRVPGSGLRIQGST